MSTAPGEPTNRLGEETSPYLLQHASNPVDWYPWGSEALELAKREDKPIFLSVGYSACHWCHVMERESFEDDGIAALLSKDFVSIKVDREERPDIDEIYMKAVQAMTGAGGWPMTVFLTPDLKPFYGGTYFPPRQKYGRPGFLDLIQSIARGWRDNRKRLVDQGTKLAEHIAAEGTADLTAQLDADIRKHWIEALGKVFDSDWGGFGEAPKFPHSLDIRGALRDHLRTGSADSLHMATLSLDKMAAGGFNDQLGGGFHRYSTDERWLIPHFEKMLYDNALLVPAYLEAYLLTSEERHLDVAKSSLDWVLREMVTPEGAFCSSQDADSEGVEGKFFSWTNEELEECLGEMLGKWASAWYGATDEGNFEHGTNALWRPEPAADVAKFLQTDVKTLNQAMEGVREALFKERAKRVAPETDDKVLASWNGLMISAFALGYRTASDERYLKAARSAASFVLGSMRQEDGRLFATARHGRAHLNAYFDDYVFMIQACLDLYESDFDEAWVREALSLASVVQAEFVDSERGGYFTTGKQHEQLIARLKNPHDGALPSGNAVHALNLLRLAEFTGDEHFRDSANRAMESVGKLASRHPSVFGQLMLAVDFQATRPRTIVLSGERQTESTREFLRVLRAEFEPSRVIALATNVSDTKLMPILEGRTPEGSETRAFICRDNTCGLPVSRADEVRREH